LRLVCDVLPTLALHHMKNTLLSTSSVRLTLGALAFGVASAAMAQTYTFKLGAGRIDPRATSGDLEGTLPDHVGGTVPVPAGNHLEVMPKSTLLFSIERNFDDHWGAELVLGAPPTHDVKLRVSDSVKAGAAQAGGRGAGRSAGGLQATGHGREYRAI
jgi:outer membrane protein